MGIRSNWIVDCDDCEFREQTVAQELALDRSESHKRRYEGHTTRITEIIDYGSDQDEDTTSITENDEPSRDISADEFSSE